MDIANTRELLNRGLEQGTLENPGDQSLYYFFYLLFRRCFNKGNNSLAAVCNRTALWIQSDITASELATIQAYPLILQDEVYPGLDRKHNERIGTGAFTCGI